MPQTACQREIAQLLTKSHLDHNERVHDIIEGCLETIPAELKQFKDSIFEMTQRDKSDASLATALAFADKVIAFQQNDMTADQATEAIEGLIKASRDRLPKRRSSN